MKFKKPRKLTIINAILLILLASIIIYQFTYKAVENSQNAINEGKKYVFSAGSGILIAPENIDIHDDDDKLEQQVTDINEKETETKEILDNIIAKPSITIAILNMGINNAMAHNAIENLPKEVVFGFSAYSQDLHEHAMMAKYKGHQILLNIPLRSTDSHENSESTEPFLLSPELSEGENIKRLNGILAKFNGFDGLYIDDNENSLDNIEFTELILSKIAMQSRILLYSGINNNEKFKNSCQAHGINVISAKNTSDKSLDIAKILEETKEYSKSNNCNSIAVINFPLEYHINSVKKWISINKDISLVNSSFFNENIVE